MNKKIMVAWFFIIVCLVLSICLIGVKEKDFALDRLKKEVISASKKYMSDNNIEIAFSNAYVIYISELVEKKYISDDNIDKYCISEVVYFNGILHDDYEIINNCKKNKE